MAFCKFCNTNDIYRGKLLPMCKHLDGSKQRFGICVFNSPEDECYVLEICGAHTDLRIEIKYCPMCGRKL